MYHTIMEHQKPNQLFALFSQVDHTIDPYFTQKAPQLPANIREILVKIAPYVTIVGVVIAALGLLVLVGVSVFTSPFLLMFAGVGGAQALAGGVLGIIFMIIQTVLEAMAIPGLFKQKRSAWELLFVAGLVGLVYDLVSLNLIGLVLHFLITFYILYQIKGYYKN
jgi:hypothetical protein